MAHSGLPVLQRRNLNLSLCKLLLKGRVTVGKWNEGSTLPWVKCSRVLQGLCLLRVGIREGQRHIHRLSLLAQPTRLKLISL